MAIIVYLRKATLDDVDLLYQWRNEEDVRKNSFNMEKVIYNTHVKWLKDKLEQTNSDIFVLCDNKIEVGQIRLDYDKEVAYISYSISKECRGKKYGELILLLAEEKLIKEKDSIRYMCGEVKFNNIASQLVFEKDNYVKEEKEDNQYISYKKEVMNISELENIINKVNDKIDIFRLKTF